MKVVITDIEAIKNGTGSIEIKHNNNIISIPFSLIDKNLLKDNSEVIFTMNSKADDTITKGLNAVKKVFEFSLSIKTGDEVVKVTKFNKDFAVITLNLTEAELKDLDKEKLTVFYYNEETKKYEALETTVDGNNVTFKTSHFSKFIVAEKTVAEDGTVLPETGGLNSSYLIVLAIVLVGIGGFILFKKNKKEQQ